MYSRTNRCYNERDSRTNYVRSSIPHVYRGADESLARPTSRCILFDGWNISFDASLVIYINSTNIPPIIIGGILLLFIYILFIIIIIIINRIYETQNLLSL